MNDRELLARLLRRVMRMPFFAAAPSASTPAEITDATGGASHSPDAQSPADAQEGR